jgi:hypothetical protein
LRKASISFFEVVCLCTSLLSSNFAQVTPVAFHELLGASQDGRKKMVPLRNLGPKLTDGVTRDIHFPAQSLLGPSENGRQFGQTDTADDQQIYIAQGVLFSSRHRAVNDGTSNLVAKPLQELLQCRYKANRLLEKTA